MIGPGKYDDLATMVRQAANARGVAVIVFAGRDGHGFAVQAPAVDLVVIPAILRHMADDLDRQIASDVSQVARDVGDRGDR